MIVEVGSNTNPIDALFDFTVHQIKKYSLGEEFVTGLICGIPGPLGSDWEGGIFPLTIKHGIYNTFEPPTCTFRADFSTLMFILTV